MAARITQRERGTGRRERARTRRRVLGFTMLEALIAFAIGGFGLLAIARITIGMQGASDLAKQMSEATIVGERKLEELRAYQQVAAYTGAQVAAGQWGFLNIATGSQNVVGTNATYTVAWTVTDAPAPMTSKTAVVDVGWTDRQGNARNANLNTVIAGTNPSSSLGLTVTPAGTPIRKPKNRDLNVPVPAIDVGGGLSAFTPPGGAASLHLVFNNTTGVLTKICTGAGSALAGWTCSNITGYLVSGFIAVDNQANATLSSPFTLVFTLTQGTFDACYNDSALATKTYAGFVTFTCVVLPNGATPSVWSGTMNVGGISIGTGSGNDKICRYSADYDGSGGITNAEHPATYANVTESLENQNFMVMKGNASCPAGTVQHQP